jgi:hypothetical protein
MAYRHPKLVSLGILLGSLLVPILGFGTQKPSPGKKPKPSQPIAVSQLPAPQPPVQQRPASPPSLEQMPATAPQVSFKGGELTIVARNSSLGAILREVQTQTGAAMDMPGTPAERVVGQFGPGPAREVLAALLNGSHFNYVLLGSPQNPNSLDKVVLIAKSSGSEEPAAGSQTANAPTMLPRQGAFVNPNDDAADMNSQDNNEEMVEPEQNAEEQVDQNNPNAQPAIKTPQQLLQELQRQQQVQQQVQQQGRPQDTPPPQIMGAPQK